MLDNEPPNDQTNPPTDTTPQTAPAPTRKRRAAKSAGAANVAASGGPATGGAVAEGAGFEAAVFDAAVSAAAGPAAEAAAKAPRKRAAKKTAAAPRADKTAEAAVRAADVAALGLPPAVAEPGDKASARRAGRRRSPANVAGGRSAGEAAPPTETQASAVAPGAAEPAHALPATVIPTVLFQAPAPDVAAKPRRERTTGRAAEVPEAVAAESPDGEGVEPDGGARRRRRGGRGRRGHGDATVEATRDEGERSRGDADLAAPTEQADAHDDDDDHDELGGTSRRRRRRRRRGSPSEIEEHAPDDPPNTVVRIREPREADGREGAQGIKGSTRLEAKKQRRREGREQIRRGRRGLVLTEAEFLARRESVDRVMVVRQRDDRTQIGVLEDGILVEHFVSTAAANRMVGNVYLGRVQNVLPGMEAAFVDIGKGRNAVLYAGEVNFDLTGMEGQPRRIESALKSGQTVLVQVTKDPIGHKGARLTSQVSLPGRYLVYVPEGSMMGISRKLPDVERTRLKSILKKVMPEGAGVIVRTAAEGASEEELARDVARLSAQWEDIKKKSETANAPSLLYSEPDLTIRVIRDVFNEDFNALVVQADSEWDTVEAYVAHVAPDLVPRLSKWTSEEDIFGHHRIDEQLAKALDRKVWLPSGGYLVIDRTEAMIVIDVNTGRFIGKGGNLEETVTKNNLEAAEEIVRQLRLRDIGGIIVIDFIDMVLESNRDLVLRRLVECLGRDRTKHQVAEVTSLGLVQMTRKRVGSGLLEAFSEVCEHCNGRGVIVQIDPVEHRPSRSITPKAVPPRGRKRAAESVPQAANAVASTDGEVAANTVGAEADTLPAGSSAPDAEMPATSTVAASGGSRTRRGGRRRGGSKTAAAAVEVAPDLP